MKRTWYVVSGGSCHTKNDREFFKNLKATNENVYMANYNPIKVVGIGNGSLMVKTPMGTNLIDITEVLYVPTLNSGLLSG